MHSYLSTEGIAATPLDILSHRESLAREQQRLLALGGQSLISFTMNIPGSCKKFPLAAAGFHEGIHQISASFPAASVLYRSSNESVGGYDAYFLLDIAPLEVKRICMSLEGSHPIGRLWDIDVLCSDGSSVSRQSLGELPRACFLCGRDAKICARSQAHDILEVRNKVISLLDSFFCNDAARVVGDCAERALLTELCTTPKPGLVDLRNNGSHSDMELSTFLESIRAIAPWFSSFYALGWSCHEENALFRKLRTAGLEAERAMFSATKKM